MSNLVNINPEEYGLDSVKAKQIEELFTPMLAKMTSLESQFNEIKVLEINPDTCKKAKALRLEYVKVRTGTDKIHKETKQFYLQAGRFIDGWKNTQKFASEGIEKELSNIENYFEIQEAARKESLRVERAALIAPYVETEPFGLGEMTTEIWDNFFTGSKTNYEAKKAAELKAEQDRLAAEKAEEQAQEQQRLENERLRKLAQEQAETLKQEQAARIKLQKENELQGAVITELKQPIQVTNFDEVINQLNNIKFPTAQNQKDVDLIHNTKVLLEKTINYIETQLTK